jgi:hypothetical protein
MAACARSNECASHSLKGDGTDATDTAMKTVICTQGASWDEVLKQAAEEDILVLRDGHPFVLMTPFDDDDLAWYARERDPSFLESLAKARLQVAQGKTVDHETLKSELGLECGPVDSKSGSQ